MWGWVGALCLSFSPDDSSGSGEANGSHPNEDRHKAPASTLPFPLSLQWWHSDFFLWSNLDMKNYREEVIELSYTKFYNAL